MLFVLSLSGAKRECEPNSAAEDTDMTLSRLTLMRVCHAFAAQITEVVVLTYGNTDF